MRHAAILLLLLAGTTAFAQDGVLINEVLPGNRGVTTDSAGRTPDWIELYNPTPRAVDMNGWRIAVAGRQHVFTDPLLVPAKGYRVLWCDGRTNDGEDHIAFPLARQGGALLLIAPDGLSIADVFSYPAMPGNVSVGRLPDGAKTWSFFSRPTPDRRNRSDEGEVRAQCAMPVASQASGHFSDPFDLMIASDPGSAIRYTLDGTFPTSENGVVYTGRIPITATSTVRAYATAPGNLPSERICATYIIGQAHNGSLALTLDPIALWSDSSGIYAPGAFSNHTRRGKEWERDGVVQWFGDTTMSVGVRIGGSGSRGARKRSFKLYASEGARFSFMDSTAVGEAMLRADAGPHAFLRNTLMEELVRRYGLHVDVQPSRSAPLYLNGTYWGHYRWMPAKDGEWLRQLAGAEALDVLEGPASVALNGNDRHYKRAQDMLLRGASKDSIDAMIDTRSLIDLACIDLWTGRADHDLNVRCYRPRQPGGRWRWVLFDMDLWAPASENSVERMCASAVAETPFIPQLLAHRALQERLLARITALQAAVFSKASHVADSLHRVNQDELLADFRRWELELDPPHPDSSLAEMKRFAAERPAHLFAQLARRTGRKLRTVSMEAPSAEQGQLLMDGHALAPGRHQVRCFSDVQIRMEVRPANGYEFADWKGLDLDVAAGAVDLSRTRNVRAMFRAVVP